MNKLKRYSKKAIQEALNNGYYIIFYDFFTSNAGYKVVDVNNKIVGYITFDLFLKLVNENIITILKKDYSSITYC